MKADFIALRDLLFNSNTYDTNGNDNWADVHGLLTELGAKIDEVEKRIECAVRSANEIVKAIAPYQEAVDNNSPFTMSVAHWDCINNCADDIKIAMDINDSMPIEDNWYNLFSPTPKVEDEETYPIVNCMDCGHPQPLLEENVHVDELGRHMVCEQCEGSFNVGGDELKPIVVGNIEYDFPEEVYSIGNINNTEIIGDVYESIFVKLVEAKVVINEMDKGFPKEGGNSANWVISHNQFIPLIKFHQIDLSKVPIIKKEVFMTFDSSWGEIDCDKDGNVLEIRGDEYIGDERSYLYDIAKSDLVEFCKFCETNNITMGEADDILAVGFWRKDNSYSDPDKNWRSGRNIFDDEKAPTMLCINPKTHEIVNNIISQLNSIDVDGETMEYILKQVGMDEQMLKQLFAKTTNDDIDYLLDVRNGKA